MEVGAVKQAYNNEVILLKKKLNQAKIQTIHKLTRKAKTLTEKKVPENLKVKFTKKAESAVKEVLIIKKIKARDVAKFIVTHKGQLSEYLNRPTVDHDKACARLLLHKALQDKYKVIRERFSNISIKDLLMSRQERRKLKKEEREKQKNKKKGKNANEPVQAEGDWDVEDINKDDSDSESSMDEHDQVDDKDVKSEEDESASDGLFKPNLILKNTVNNQIADDSDKDSGESHGEVESDDESEEPNDSSKLDHQPGESNDSGDEESAGKFVKLASILPKDNVIVSRTDGLQNESNLMKIKHKKEVVKKHKDNNKNNNLKNKILSKKFKKETTEIPQENKVVDPFFITATGENYMSVAETRPPDEVKEVHQQGNRKYRRAVMFGLVPKRQRRDDFRPGINNSRFNKFDDNSNRNNFSSNFKNNGFDNHGPSKRFDKSIESSNRGNFNDRRNDKSNEETKPEKLHPSWEAKKRQSGILPFQGKKIVFDEG